MHTSGIVFRKLRLRSAGHTMTEDLSSFSLHIQWSNLKECIALQIGGLENDNFSCLKEDSLLIADA